MQDLILTQLCCTDERKEANFVALLKAAGIHRPDEEVLASIVKRCSYSMLAAASTGSASVCRDLYEAVRDSPSTTTRGIIEQQEHISLNGPFSGQMNTLTGVDLLSGELILLKLLVLPESAQSTTHAELCQAVQLEAKTSEALTKANIPGIVKSEVVTVEVENSQGLKAGRGPVTALKMRLYFCSLAECPQLSETFIEKIFHRILGALQGMHELGYVHMDVKSKNILVGASLSCDLCDFGSARQRDEPTFSLTAGFNPYVIPTKTPVIPSMDYVQLCVTIAIELQKDSVAKLSQEFVVEPDVKSFRTRYTVKHVAEDLIRQRLQQIRKVEFRETMLSMFTEHVNKVKQHLQKQKSASQQGL